jgi:hypothetical protein
MKMPAVKLALFGIGDSHFVRLSFQILPSQIRLSTMGTER